MIKKIFLLFAFLTICFSFKAQVTSVEYPSGYLSEERIIQILDKLKKEGANDKEIATSNQMLHELLKKQELNISNGTFGQKTIQQPPQIMGAGCNNPGFEDGTANGWTFQQATANGATLPCPTCFTGVAGGVYEVTTIGVGSTVNSNAGNNTGGDASNSCLCSNTNTNDCSTQPYSAAGTDRFGGFSVVAPAPLGGSHSMMLNNSNCGYLMQKATQTFSVMPANVSFTFQYAVVLQDGGHPASAAPYFIVEVTDVATGTVVPCTQYSASATGATSGNLNGWTVSPVDASVYYKPWQTVTINLSSMLGRSVNVSFTVSDCNASGHFGYAYIDASCNPLQITKLIPLCPGQNAVLSGPPGMASYLWSPGGATTQNITTSTVGNYTLVTTMASGCPSPNLFYNLTQDPDPVPSFAQSSPPCSGSLTFTDGSTVAAPDTITNWVWNFGDGTAPVNSTTSAAQTHAYATPGAYTVTLTDTTNNHCVASYSFVVHAAGGGPNPTFSSNSPATAPQCLAGNNVVFTNASTVTGSVTITGYVWDYGDGSPTVTSTTVSPNPPPHTYAASGTYVVTLTVNVVGCSSTITQTVVIDPMPTATISAPPVCLGNATVFTSTITNGNTYNWDYGNGGAPVAGTATPSHTYTLANTYAVSLTVTSTGGCTVTATTNVLVSPVPTATFTVAAVCEGTPSHFDASASTPVGGTYSWNFGGAAPNTDVQTGVQTDNHIYTTSGTFPVTLLITVGTCSATATGNAVVNPMPVLSISSTPACDLSPICFTNSTAAQGTFTVWAWTYGDGIGTSASPNPPCYTYPAPGIYTVTLTASTSTGCSGTVSTTAIVHPNPLANGSLGFACMGGGSTFTDASTVTNPPGINDAITGYSWSFGDGQNSALSSPTHTYATCGSYSISLTVTTSFNCTNTVSGMDTVYCIPNVTSPPSFSICPGAPVTSAQTTFTTVCAQPALGIPVAIYFVDNPNPNTNITNPHGGIPLPDTSGINNIPNYNAIAQNLTCGLLIDTIYGYAVTDINGNIGCVGNVQTFTISVYPTPTVSPVNSVTVCANATVSTINFTGCPTPETFNWSTTGSNVGITSTSPGNISAFSGKNTTDLLAVTQVSVTPVAHGCTGIPTTFSITVNPLPTMTVTSPPPYCPSDLVSSTDYNINTDPVGGVTYTFTSTNTGSTGMPATGTGSAPNSPYHAPANGTLANVTGVTSYTPSLNGCIGPVASNTITIKPTPVIQPIADVAYCPNQATQVIPFVCLPTNQGTPNYNWIISTNPYNVGLNPSSGTTDNIPSFTTSANNTSGAQSANVTLGASLNNCPSTFSNFTIIVNPTPVPKFSYIPACDGSPTIFTDLSTPNSGSITVNQWYWDMNNDGLPDATTQNPHYVVGPAGTDSVKLTVATSSAPSCTAQATFTVYVNPNPVVDFSGDSLKSCPQLNTQFTPLVTINPPANLTYAWSFGNGNTSASPTPPVQTYTNGSPTQSAYYNVSLTVTSDAGCTATQTKPKYIQVYPRPIADFGWGPVGADIDDPTITFVNQAIGTSGYPVAHPTVYGANGVQYYLGDVFATNQNSNNVTLSLNPDNSTFTHTYEYYDAYTYYVTQWVINSWGCKDSITKPVEILPDFTFYIPNAFTPNGDGTNEGFKGTGIGIDNSTYNLWVFDRWGLMIFYSDDLDKAWDGHMNGNEGRPILQEDVYVWKVKFKDNINHKLHEYHGTVTLIK